MFAENVGRVIVYDWVEWIRENVEPHALSSDAVEEIAEPNQLNEDIPSHLSRFKSNEVPVPLPEKEFMGGIHSDEFIVTSKCVRSRVA